MTWDNLLSGVVGAAIISFVDFVRSWCSREQRIKGCWQALKAEINHCRDCVKKYRADNVQSPLYRLPTICYQNCLPILLADSGTDEERTKDILAFYVQAETINRGLDLANQARDSGDPDRIKKESRRLNIKIEELINENQNNLYDRAIEACNKSLKRLWRVC